jgi:hypothetical protein
MNASLKNIWSEEPSDKHKEQRDFVLRHMLYQNRPCLLADHVQAHGGAVMRNKSEDVKNLLFKGMKQVLELVSPANGRAMRPQLPLAERPDLNKLDILDVPEWAELALDKV